MQIRGLEGRGTYKGAERDGWKDGRMDGGMEGEGGWKP